MQIEIVFEIFLVTLVQKGFKSLLDKIWRGIVMNSEESYLDSLLRNILNPEAAELGKDKTQIDTVAEEQAIQKSQLEETETDKTESMTVNLQLLDIPENLTEKKETSVLEGVTDTLEKPSIVEGIT